MKAELAGFSRDIDLQIDLRKQSHFASNPMDVLREIQTVHAMDGLDRRQYLAHLVGLEMADQMPPRGRWQFRLFCQHFLHTVFTKKAMSCIISLPHDLCWESLGNNYKLRFFCISARST